jgi:hypothetical protein
VADPPRVGSGAYRTGGADWLRLWRVERLRHYAAGDDERVFATALGFRELTRTRRPWARVSPAP